MAGWILKSSDPEMTIRLPANGIKTLGRSARAEFIVEAALVSRLHCRLTTDEAGMETARQMSVDLYQGVDLGGGIAAPDEGPGIAGGERQPELYEQWWFWTVVGVVVVAGAVGVGAGVAASSPGIPDGWTRVDGNLP